MLPGSCGLRGALPSLPGMHAISWSSLNRLGGRQVLAARCRPAQAASRVRASRQTDQQEHVVSRAALAAAAASLALNLDGGVGALAARADALDGTVPLRRAVVENMLLQQLSDRLHSLSDQQLAELLEQLLREDARFPTELLQPPTVAPPAAAPGAQQPLAPAMPALVQPQLPSPQQQQQEQQQPWQAQQQPAVQEQPAVPASSASGGDVAAAGSSTSGGAAGAAGAADAAGSLAGTARGLDDEQQEAPDLTEQLLQQFQRQLEARSGGIGAAGDRARAGSSGAATGSWLPALPGGLPMADNWRLIVLAVVGPAALITSLGQLLGRQGEEARRQEQQQGPTSPTAEAQVPPAALPAAAPGAAAAAAQQQQQQPKLDLAAAGKGEQKQRSFLAWLLNPAAAEEAPDEQASPEPTADMQQQQQQPAQQQAPPPPPLPPPPPPLAGVSGGLTDASAAPGAVLWQRKTPAAAVAESDSSTNADSGILWQRRGPAADAAADQAAAQPAARREQQPGPQGEGAEYAPPHGDTAGSSKPELIRQVADDGSAGDAAGPAADLWRMPLEQLRSGGGSDAGSPAGAQPALVEDAASRAAAAGTEAGLRGAGHAEGNSATAVGNTAPSPLPGSAEAMPAATPAAAAEQGRQRSPSPAPARRQASPLDNAEPDGWLGRLQRMGRRPPTAAGQRDADL